MLRTIQRIVLCASLFLFLVLESNPLWACSISCAPPEKTKWVLPNEKLESYDAVFLGTLIDYKTEPIHLKEESCEEEECIFDSSWCFGPEEIHVYTFEIHTAWKGVHGTTLSLSETSYGQGYGFGCGTPNVVLDNYPRRFELGRYYLVYADRNKNDNQLYPQWRATRPAKLAAVEMMFLNAARKNQNVANVVKQLPDLLRSPFTRHVTKAEAIMWLRLAPPQMSPEDRKKLSLEVLVNNHESLRNMVIKPIEGKDFEGLPGYQGRLNENDSDVITAVALALGNEEFKGDPDIIHILIYLLNGADHRVNIAAAVSLKKLGLKDKKIEKRIYEVLKYGLHHNTASKFQNLAYSALYEIKNPALEIFALRKMKKNLPDDSSREHKDFLSELIRIQWKSLAKNIESPKNP